MPVTYPYTLPTKEVVIKHLETFLKFHGCGIADLAIPSGGIFYWFNPSKIYLDIESLFDPTVCTSAGEVPPTDHITLCTINIVMALSCQVTALGERDPSIETELSSSWRPFVPGLAPTSTQEEGYSQSPGHLTSCDPPSVNAQPGLIFFARAKLLLVNPIEEATLPCLRVVTLMSFYLLSANKMEAAYMYVGVGIRMAVAHGLHRTRKKVSSLEGVECYGDATILGSKGRTRIQLEAEERKREFWNIYILDRFNPNPSHFYALVGDIDGAANPR
jgi:Fungal specific transcription factor domain